VRDTADPLAASQPLGAVFMANGMTAPVGTSVTLELSFSCVTAPFAILVLVTALVAIFDSVTSELAIATTGVAAELSFVGVTTSSFVKV
jgi:hypothetical protein